MEFPNKNTILETVYESLNTPQNLMNVLTHQPYHFNSSITNTTVAKFKKLSSSSLLNRTGHARFRRAPVVPLPQSPQTSFPSTNTPQPPLHIQAQHQSLNLDFTKPNILRFNPKSLSLDLEFPKETISVSSNSSFMLSIITDNDSVSNNRQGSYIFPAPVISGGKPPFSLSSSKNKCHSHFDDEKRSCSNKLHRTNKRKNKMKRTVRVAAISDKIADIPKDEYLWRKYGQKLIKESPYPRGYYKCTTMKECPARKKVERAKDDPKMMIVTYEEEHCHEIDTENISRSVGFSGI